jgi:sarcosine oxidase subunit beta
MRALATEATGAGVVVLERTEVCALDYSAAAFAWHVTCRAVRDITDDPATGETDRICIAAREVVVAVGGYTSAVVELTDPSLVVPVISVVGQMWATAPTTKVLNHMVCSIESDYYWASHPTTSPPSLTHSWVGAPRLTRHLYGKQCPDGSLIFGGDRRRHPYQQVGDEHCLPYLLDGMHLGCYRHACEVLPIIETLPLQRQWGGVMPFTPDGHPIIGPLLQAKSPGLWVCTGFGGCGFMQGSMAGYLLAEQMAGASASAAVVLLPSSPERFQGLAPTGPTSSTGAGAGTGSSVSVPPPYRDLTLLQ